VPSAAESGDDGSDPLGEFYARNAAPAGDGAVAAAWAALQREWAGVGLGRIVTLYCRSSTLYRIH
jgi:hypothetical protein